MGEEVFEQKLAWFKENEKPEVVLLVADDPKKVSVVVAWSNMFVDHKPGKKLLEDKSESKAWDWMWKQVDFSMEEFIEKSALSEYEVKKNFTHLVGNRVLYPDGTVHSFVQRYLREKVVNLFTAKAKKSSRTKKS